MSFELTEAERSMLAELGRDRRRMENIVAIINDYEGDVVGLRSALQEGIDPDSGAKNVYKFDPTLIILLIKLAPVIWELVKHFPDIIEFFRSLRNARRNRRARRRGEDT